MSDLSTLKEFYTLTTLECPHCHNTEAFSIVETLMTRAEIQFDAETRQWQYTGQSDIDWNSQTPVRTESGDLRIQCDNCDYEFTTSSTIVCIALPAE